MMTYHTSPRLNMKNVILNNSNCLALKPYISFFINDHSDFFLSDIHIEHIDFYL